MNLQRIGSEKCGWTIDLDSVQDGSTVLDLGIGDDDSFSRELLKLKKVTVLAIDPSQTSKEYYYHNPPPPGMVFLSMAINSVYSGGYLTFCKGDGRSDAAYYTDMPGMTKETYDAPALDIYPLCVYNNVTLIKMDIEGMEYRTLMPIVHLDVIKQIVVEFHTIQRPQDNDKFKYCLSLMERSGYKIVAFTERNEITFLR